MGSSSESTNPSRHRDLVVGGSEANRQRFPYYTLLKTFTKYGTGRTCGGTLIAPDVVMTAAHCIEGSDEDELFGDSSPIVGVDAFVNSTTVEYSKFEYYRSGIKWMVHPDRDRLRLSNDVAIIFLNAPVLEVPPVKVNKDANIPVSDDPTTLTVIGLGANGTNTTDDPFSSGFTSYITYPDQLMKIEIDTVSTPSCKKMYGSFFVGDSNFCAGVDYEKGVCLGDDGGPVLLTKSSAADDVQIGIISLVGSYYCGGGAPDVYTRMSSYAGWIDDQVCQFSKSKPSTCPTLRPTRKPTKKPVSGRK